MLWRHRGRRGRSGGTRVHPVSRTTRCVGRIRRRRPTSRYSIYYIFRKAPGDCKGMYSVFRPDLDAPTREDAELAFPAVQAIPVPYIEPQDVSNAVLFLASDDSPVITGTP